MPGQCLFNEKNFTAQKLTFQSEATIFPYHKALGKQAQKQRYRLEQVGGFIGFLTDHKTYCQTLIDRLKLLFMLYGLM